MYRILIADDDTIVRIFLTDIVQWEKHDFTVVGIARDGEEALDIARTAAPDVVLTDISMPRMDGIRLIRQLRAEGYDGVINVLSCHDDFELVKNAMQQGADDYLLKNSLTDTSMDEILNRFREQIQRCHQKTTRNKEMQQLARKGIRVIQRELLEGILRGEMAGEPLTQRMQEAGLYGRYRRLYAVLIQPGQADPTQVEALLSLCTQRLENEPAEALLLHKNILALLIDLSDMPSAKQSLEQLNRLETIIDRIAQQYLNLELSMASSAVCDGKNAIAEALRQANDMLQNHFYGVGRWQYGVDRAMADELPEQAKRFRKELPEMLDSGDDESIRRSYADALEAIRRERVVSGSVLSWLRRCDHIAGVARTEDQYSEMLYFEAYIDCAEEYIAHRQSTRLSEIPETVSPIMRSAAQYIQLHFRESIGLNDVADQVGLSSAYFSTLFKREMQIGFSEYLLSLRLKWVCDRMKTTGQTIKRISGEAGFADYPYFCKMFKKKLGMSPAAYRNMHQ